MRVLQYALLSAALAAGALQPGGAAAQAPGEPAGPDTVVFNASRGKVTFTHAKHSKANECASCHHASRPEKPLTAAKQKCTDCHAAEPVPPMKTALKDAFHNTGTGEGTCLSCHAKKADTNPNVPSACGDCHKKDS